MEFVLKMLMDRLPFFLFFFGDKARDLFIYFVSAGVVAVESGGTLSQSRRILLLVNWREN